MSSCAPIHEDLVEPRTRVTPLPTDRSIRDVQDRRSLFGRQSGEEPELHDLRLTRIQLGELGQGTLEFEDVQFVATGRRRQLLEWDSLGVATSLAPSLSARVIGEDLPHGSRGDGEEVVPTAPCGVGPVDHLEERFVDQGRRLERVIHGLVAEVSVRDPPKLFVDERKQLIDGSLVSITDAKEETRRFIGPVGALGRVRLSEHCGECTRFRSPGLRRCESHFAVLVAISNADVARSTVS